MVTGANLRAWAASFSFPTVAGFADVETDSNITSDSMILFCCPGPDGDPAREGSVNKRQVGMTVDGFCLDQVEILVGSLSQYRAGLEEREWSEWRSHKRSSSSHKKRECISLLSARIVIYSSAVGNALYGSEIQEQGLKLVTLVAHLDGATC